MANEMATAKCSKITRRKIVQKSMEDIGILSTTAMFQSNSKKGRKTQIAISPEDQMALQRAGGMTDRGAN